MNNWLVIESGKGGLSIRNGYEFVSASGADEAAREYCRNVFYGTTPPDEISLQLVPEGAISFHSLRLSIEESMQFEEL